MFEDSLLESAKRKVEGNRAKATLLSIMLQILLVLALILFPLLYTEALPFRVAEAALAMPTAITGPPPTVASARRRHRGLPSLTTAAW